MEAPRDKPPRTDEIRTDDAVDSIEQQEVVTIQLVGSAQSGATAGYSLLFEGDIETVSALSEDEPEAAVVPLDGERKLLSGNIADGTDGFVLVGSVLAAEFDDPEPTVKLDGTVVESGQWPTLDTYIGSGPGQEPVEDPFPDSGMLGAPLGDPLRPSEFVLELTAPGGDETGSYRFDVDGEILSGPDGSAVSETGDSVSGELLPGESAAIELRGMVTGIETHSAIEFTTRAR